jgi:hypothetical protein
MENNGLSIPQASTARAIGNVAAKICGNGDMPKPDERAARRKLFRVPVREAVTTLSLARVARA